MLPSSAAASSLSWTDTRRPAPSGFGLRIRTSPCGGFSGLVQLGGDSEKTQNTLEGLDVPSGRGTPGVSQEDLGDVWRDGRLGCFTEPAADATRISGANKTFTRVLHQMEALHHHVVVCRLVFFLIVFLLG